MGDACAQGSEQALQTAAAPGWLCRIQEEREESSWLQRLVTLAPSEAQGGVRACARVCVCERVCVRPDTHVPPTHACSYLLAKAAVGAMAAKDAAPDDQHPHGGTAALSPASRMATE